MRSAFATLLARLSSTPRRRGYLALTQNAPLKRQGLTLGRPHTSASCAVDASGGQQHEHLEGERLLASTLVRAWPRLRAESVFFLPCHLPGVDAGSSEVPDDEPLLSGDGASWVWRRSKY